MKKEVKVSPAAKKIYQLKVMLRDIRPPVWRRIQVAEDIPLSRFHDLLQVVMGWWNSHLHQFRVGETYYGIPDPEFRMEVKNEKKFRLNQILRRPKARMIYEYDFGDGWEHDVVLEDILSPTPGARYPVVLAGRRRCPPEDVGGTPGYEHFLEAMRDPAHPEHQEFLDWLGDTFDPEEFSAEGVDEELRGGGWG